MVAIEQIKRGDFFKKKEGAKKTFVRGEYCRINKAYECQNWDDANEYIYLKKGTIVYEDCENW